MVVEPASNYVERDGTRYSMMKLFLNGEEVACLGYVPGGGSLIQTKYITMDGKLGDLYLYYMMVLELLYGMGTGVQELPCPSDRYRGNGEGIRL
ncbi:hypothetical protein NXX52_19940 [Bacteroides ovatus]|nr:hypothetical protein [Bacteroides ovatus]